MNDVELIDEIVAYIEDRGASWWFAPYKENKE